MKRVVVLLALASAGCSSLGGGGLAGDAGYGPGYGGGYGPPPPNYYGAPAYYGGPVYLGSPGYREGWNGRHRDWDGGGGERWRGGGGDAGQRQQALTAQQQLYNQRITAAEQRYNQQVGANPAAAAQAREQLAREGALAQKRLEYDTSHLR